MLNTIGLKEVDTLEYGTEGVKYVAKTLKEKHFAYFYKSLSGPSAKENLAAGLEECAEKELRSAGRANPPRASFCSKASNNGTT